MESIVQIAGTETEQLFKTDKTYIKVALLNIFQIMRHLQL